MMTDDRLAVFLNGGIFMREVIERALQGLEEHGTIEVIRPVAGGDINESYYVRTNKQQYFVKLNRRMDETFFAFEAKGLEMIRNTNTIRVPAVYQVLTDEQQQIPMLWMEWIEGNKGKNTDTLLGEQLAALHLNEGAHYGWEGVSYIGRLKQNNEWSDNWFTYYRDQRIMQQVQIGERLGVINGKRQKRLMKLIERLHEWIPERPRASILHGDLWGGNWMIGHGGMPYLIDPSVLYGDHEFEIAFTELFGGFSIQFYEAYQSVFPLTKEYEERKSLYQLYYLLVHLNMFGESYGSSVDRILQKYV